MFGIPSAWLPIGSGLIGAIAAGWLVHKIDTATLNDYKLAQARVQSKAVADAIDLERKQAAIALNAAVAEAEAQEKIIVETETIVKEVVRHVKDVPNCPTFGVVRIYNASLSGAGVDSFPIPTGKSDDSSAGITTDSFAQSLAINNGRCRANSQQLNALIDYVRQLRGAWESQFKPQ